MMKSGDFQLDLVEDIASKPGDLGLRHFKRTRRGKKRRIESSDEPTSVMSSQHIIDNGDGLSCDIINTQGNKAICVISNVEEPDAGEVAGFGCPSKNRIHGRQRILRPLDVPKAPNNFTQFIMDDHENCNLYLSFESPKKILSRRSTSVSSGCSVRDKHETSPQYKFSGYDMDFEYESPDDLDTTDFFEKDFEIIYRRAREEEIMTLSCSDLIERFIDLESKATHYEHMLSDKDGIPSMTKLQTELLKLQEENKMLRNTNRYLTGSPSDRKLMLLNSELSDDESSDDCTDINEERCKECSTLMGHCKCDTTIEDKLIGDSSGFFQDLN